MKKQVLPSLGTLTLALAMTLLGLFVFSYFVKTGNLDIDTNLSFTGFYFGFFLLPVGLVLKITELKPVPQLSAPPANIEQLRTQQTQIQQDILRDISKYVYLKATHMQDPLHALKLGGVKSDSDLPKLIGYREEVYQGRYALILQFSADHVPLPKWQERQTKLDTFFGKDVAVTVQEVAPARIELTLVRKA
ncbi:DUF2854 domain-containing protein [Anthocerotibacter panamensis]|uniref:DUF2854 domain-containing protein n=1 Tax=Anthocerotibacter panamensis TaxID=2857077 RepID=UPI001C404E55|nr:DUF2854 domain-containing protein [Anthocerotibacter panamensis]